MTNKLRIYEFAKLLDMQNKDLMDVLNKLNIEHKNHMSALEENDINLVLEYILQEKDKQQAERRAERRNVSKDQQVQEKRQKIEDRKPRKFDEKPRHERKVEEKEKSRQLRDERQKEERYKKEDKPVKSGARDKTTVQESRKTIEIEPKQEVEKKQVSKPKYEVAKEQKIEKKFQDKAQAKQKQEKAPKHKKQTFAIEEEHHEEVILGREELEKVDREVEDTLLEEEYLQEKHVRRGRKEKLKKKSKEQKEVLKLQTKPAQEEKKEEVIKIPEKIVVGEFANLIGKPAAEIIKKLIMLGVMANINQEIDFDIASLIAEDYGFKVEKEIIKTEEEILLEDQEDPSESLVPRPPVVVVMGHVDHGKTSLLDAIRKTNVTEKEAGGITQHIGASVVEINGRKITFLDTPGHEAFTAMRARGAQVTDIAVLVVAADDGVMPQTVEAINHAKAANVTIIVAINKIDKPEANPERVKQQLSEYGLIPEEWGGDTVFVNVSAKKKIGIDHLLEMILLVADLMELKANPNRPARGRVIEAKLDKGRGPVATVLIQKGTLKVGDYVVVGNTWGRIRAMMDDKGQRIKEAGPSMPVEILGLEDVPIAGDELVCVKDEKTAKTVAQIRQEKLKEEKMQSTKISLDELFERIQKGQLKELRVIIKADVQGSVEALKSAVERLSNDKVTVKVIHAAVGAITESDVTLASASDAIIIGFNVRPEVGAMSLAEKEKVDVRMYRIIYDVINDIEAAMKGLLEPVYKEVVIGHAEVRQIFKSSAVGTIAGCYVLDGKITRTANARIIRDGVVVYEGKLASLKRFKDDVREVAAGYECGMTFEKFNDIKEGDIVEAYEMQKVEN
ncbi:translation initiation factor IF-2 [Caldicellulosiruptor bescii]|uniref:Translation initiation factor IF-2 n=2 Tax=Caldicellulosiruptor bescii TaxID=31899 RepID=B9MR48_CALBD|nr:translation initiation factor IF-2 [Caldicellulosiruptor bescii]ACM60152.1 translation initiation factor IF-2 [Caldicellulosiruptor bescii DSM 6725]PBC87567.1 translation initiation factor IF-2 [Caldicellulosiruptor bescii]PBC90500.1 translation initiation factor IF-2 [Caldicellulosiruptor bescii]PBD04068.1 translation initiation factor IF-2 [Caldicellulosiruptor bescii]PBD06297.1 translation initiation factor IF-2 [Caldicellulosiruptor bescii]